MKDKEPNRATREKFFGNAKTEKGEAEWRNCELKI
jgi:hypothetical protein